MKRTFTFIVDHKKFMVCVCFNTDTLILNSVMITNPDDQFKIEIDNDCDYNLVTNNKITPYNILYRETTYNYLPDFPVEIHDTINTIYELSELNVCCISIWSYLHYYLETDKVKSIEIYQNVNGTNIPINKKPVSYITYENKNDYGFYNINPTDSVEAIKLCGMFPSNLRILDIIMYIDMEIEHVANGNDSTAFPTWFLAENYTHAFTKILDDFAKENNTFIVMLCDAKLYCDINLFTDITQLFLDNFSEPEDIASDYNKSKKKSDKILYQLTLEKSYTNTDDVINKLAELGYQYESRYIEDFDIYHAGILPALKTVDVYVISLLTPTLSSSLPVVRNITMLTHDSELYTMLKLIYG